MGSLEKVFSFFFVGVCSKRRKQEHTVAGGGRARPRLRENHHLEGSVSLSLCSSEKKFQRKEEENVPISSGGGPAVVCVSVLAITKGTRRPAQ